MAAAWPGKVKTATQMVAIILLFINNIPFNLIGIPVDQIMLYACLILLSIQVRITSSKIAACSKDQCRSCFVDGQIRRFLIK